MHARAPGMSERLRVGRAKRAVDWSNLLVARSEAARRKCRASIDDAEYGLLQSASACVLAGAVEPSLTPRQRAYRHGKYQRADDGRIAGTLSIPEVPHGWQ